MFYKNNLENIEALIAEKRALENKLVLLNTNADFFSEKKTKGSKAKSSSKQQNILSAILGNSNIASIAAQLIPLLLPSISKKVIDYGAKKLLIKVSTEIGAGYIKWKTIELISTFIYKKLKTKKED